MIKKRERIAANPWGGERDVPRNFVHNNRFYNEIVMEYLAFEQHLPLSIEAIFYVPAGGCRDVRPQPWMGQATRSKCEAYARWAHEKLLERWPQEARSIPLLTLDMHSRESPFGVPLASG